jgi:hypothetical protein
MQVIFQRINFLCKTPLKQATGFTGQAQRSVFSMNANKTFGNYWMDVALEAKRLAIL